MITFTISLEKLALTIIINAILTYWRALLERITGVVRRTRAVRIVVAYVAQRVQSARVRTRIGAFLVDARLIERALRTDDALRTTIRRTIHVSWQTGAHRLVVDRSALAVRAARRRIARIVRRWFS